MQQNKRKPKPLFTTAVGVSDYPYLFKPDTKFNADGEYSVKLTLSKEDAKEHIKRYEDTIKNLMDETGSQKRSVHNQYKDVDGGVQFKFKMKAKVKTDAGDYDQRPVIYDAQNNIIDKELPCYSGSKMSIAYQIYPYNNPMLGCGVSLRLVSAQITELKQESPDGKGSKKSSPFEKKKQGFDASSVEIKEQVTEKSSDEVSPEEEDF